MWIVNAKKDEAVCLSTARKIFITGAVRGKYDIGVVPSEDLSLNFYAGIECDDYETVQKVFLRLVKEQNLDKAVIIDDEFISETLKE